MRDVTSDVVVVGYGGAGAVAAIEAADAGASVLVLERLAEGGGVMRSSGGTFRDVVDADKAASHFHALSRGSTPLEVMRAYARGVTEIPAWLRKHGGEAEAIGRRGTEGRGHRFRPGAFPYTAPTTQFPDYVGADGLGGRLWVRGEGDVGGPRLWELLERGVRARGVRVLYDTRAVRLTKNASGRVVGVVASDGEGDLEVRAKRAVILACGGFARDAELQRQFLGVEVPALAAPEHNLGDGIRMALDAGADLWHMNAVVACFGYKLPGPGGESVALAHVLAKGLFVVDQTGRRYIDETTMETHAGLLATQVMDPVRGGYRRIPSYLIFDERTRRSGPISDQNNSSGPRRFTWSADNSAEVAAGWLASASTLTGLAQRLGLPADQLERTGRAYNDAARGGTDEFGRDGATMPEVGTPPFYGIALWPVIVNTQGGPRRNERAQVIGAFGQPIPGLFAAGELGSIWGQLYPGAGNVTECIVFGRIAGHNAARETPIG